MNYHNQSLDLDCNFAVVHSMSVVLVLLMYCLLLLSLGFIWFMFCYVVLSVLSIFAEEVVAGCFRLIIVMLSCGC